MIGKHHCVGYPRIPAACVSREGRVRSAPQLNQLPASTSSVCAMT